MIFLLLVSVLFWKTTYHLYILVGGIGGREGIKMASDSIPSANEPAKDLILVHSTAKTNDKNKYLRKNGMS